MIGRQFKFHNGEHGAALAIRVKHSRGDSNFSKVLKDGTVIVQLKQGEGEVNARLIDFVSRELKIPKKRLQVIAGKDGSKKLISIVDKTPNQIQKIVLELIS